MERQQVTVDEKRIKEQVKNEAVKGLISQIGTSIVAISGFLGLLGYSFEWLNPETINAFIVVLYAVGGTALTVYGIYKNHFSGKKAQKQNEALKEKGLKK